MLSTLLLMIKLMTREIEEYYQQLMTKLQPVFEHSVNLLATDYRLHCFIICEFFAHK